jgi:hypothetical protein
MLRDVEALLMTTTDVRSLVRSVIVTYGLPFAVMSVVDSLDGWKIAVHAGNGEILQFIVEASECDEMRSKIRRTLEAER